MKHITDIFFDLDHTLWDFDRNSVLAFDKIFKAHHPTLDTAEFIEVYAPINQACWKLYQVDKMTHEELRYLLPKYNLHIITNGFADVQYKKINNSGLSSYFKTVTNSEMAGVKKPHRNIFEFALSLAKANKENAIMIGDCIDADVKGAIDFGMKAILFDEKSHHVMPEVTTIRRLIELKNIL